MAEFDKPAAEWKKLLPAERCRVLFEEGTEAPFSSPLNDEKQRWPRDLELADK